MAAVLANTVFSGAALNRGSVNRSLLEPVMIE